MLTMKVRNFGDMFSSPFLNLIDSSLVLGNSVSEESYTDTNGLICPYYDHCKGIHKRIQFCNITVPYKDFKGTHWFLNLPLRLYTLSSSPQECWCAERTKNEVFRDLLHITHQNEVKFTFIPCDSCGAVLTLCQYC